MPLTTDAITAAVIGRACARAHYAMWLAFALPLLAGAGGQSALPDTHLLFDRLPTTWQDDRGQTLRLQALRGRRIFVTMAYTACHRICPMTMARLGELQRDLDALNMSAEFLIVSYDPSNDDSVAWQRYRTNHHLVRGNWHFLSGTPADTARLAAVLGFESWRDGEHVMHDFRIVALGGDGAERGVIDSAHGDWQDLL